MSTYVPGADSPVSPQLNASAGRLFSVVVQLRPTQGATVPATGGHLSHALLLSLISQVDPALATALHDQANYRPFTVSALNGPMRRVVERPGHMRLQPNALYWLRFTLLESRVWSGFMNRLLVQSDLPSIRYGEVHFSILRVISSPAPSPVPAASAYHLPRASQSNSWAGWAQHSTWTELAARVEKYDEAPSRAGAKRGKVKIAFRFYSPTAFSLSTKRPDTSGVEIDAQDSGLFNPLDLPGAVTQDSSLITKETAEEQPGWSQDGGKRMEIWPRPELVFGSLARTWSLYSPLALSVGREDLAWMVTEGVIVNRYELRSQMLQFPKHKQVGFTGDCIYECAEDTKLAPILEMLADFALYAGIGYKTTMGMGQARRLTSAEC